MKYAWNGSKIVFSLIFCGAMFAFCGCEESEETFYTYQGYRDFWRIPLKYPFQVGIIDRFDDGYLEKYDVTRKIDESLSADSVLEQEISAIFPGEAYVAFRCTDGQYGVFVYQTEQGISFDSAEKMNAYLVEHFSTTSDVVLQNLKKCYDETWRKLKAGL